MKFLKYVHSDGVIHPRPQHVAWNGLTLPIEHAFWHSHYDTELVSYHLHLLQQADLIVAECSTAIGRPLYCYGQTLTWNGHEFLDTIRADTAWNRITKTAREKGLDLSFNIITAISEGMTKALVL